MSALKNLVGLRFSRLEVIARDGGDKWGRAKWICRCNCGKIKVVAGCHLRSGKTQSCGCLQKEVVAERLRTHGMVGTPTYRSWGCMLSRCTDPNHKQYAHYGGRGIEVCDRWLKFEGFFADMGKKPKGLTVERMDNNKGYFPENCIYATYKEQNRNSRNNRMVRYKGKTKCLAEWAEELKINYETLRSRLDKYPPQIAFNM